MKKLYLFLFLILVAVSLFGQNVEIQGDATITGQVTVMDTIHFADGTELASACLQILQDVDGDTKIEVEQSLDEDIIRFTSDGVEVAVFKNNILTVYGVLNINDVYTFPEISGIAGQILSYDGSGAMQWTNSSATSTFSDADGDTKIELEQTLDEDTIRLQVDGHLIAKLDNNTLHLEAQSHGTFIGLNAGKTLPNAASWNTFVGHRSGENTNSGISNTFLGAYSGSDGNKGSANTFIGVTSGGQNTGSNNTFLGISAGQQSSGGSDNTYLGAASGSQQTGSQNIGIGPYASYIGSGNNNIGIGFYSSFTGTGNNNIGIGNYSLSNVGNGTSELLAIGDSSLHISGQNITFPFQGIRNTAIGHKTLKKNRTGLNNTSVGYHSLENNDSGSSNTAIGANASNKNETGINNTALGSIALYNNIQGASNTAVGAEAGRFSSGSRNTFVGAKSGENNVSGSGNIFIGNQAGQHEIGNDKLYIENSSSSTPLIYGEFDSNKLEFDAWTTVLRRLDIDNNNLQFTNLGTGDTDKGIKFGSTSTGLIGLTFENQGNYQDKLHIKTFYDQVGASFMTFDGSNGKVGIGTEDPEAHLHIDKTTDASLTGNGLLVLGPIANENIVIDANEMQARNNSLADDLNFNIDGGDIHFGRSTIEQEYEFRNGDILMSYLGSSDLDHGLKWSETEDAVFGFIYDGAGSGDANRLHLRKYLNGTEDIMTFKVSGNVGVGEADPETKLHVKTSSTSGHVMKIENTSSASTADGLEIKINRTASGLENNFVTFSNSNSTAGRIEGFALGEGPNFSDFPGIDFDTYFDVQAMIDAVFDPGEIGTICQTQAPNLPNSFTTPSFQINFIPFGVCLASFGSNETACNEAFENFSPGIFDVPVNEWDVGIYEPCGWVEPTFNLSGLINPVILTSAYADMQAVVNWALEKGVEAYSADPFHIALMNQPEYWLNMATFKHGGVTYGSKGADYAEWLEREDPSKDIKAGQIVGVKNGKISLNTEDADQIMAISVMPVVLGNMPDTTRQDDYEKVAFIGQTPVWVVGEVKSGDYIIASGNNDGFGIPVSEEELTIEQVSQVVGRAWEDGDRLINLVNIAVGLKTNEMASILGSISEEMKTLDQRLSSIEAIINTETVAIKE